MLTKVEAAQPVRIPIAISLASSHSRGHRSHPTSTREPAREHRPRVDLRGPGHGTALGRRWVQARRRAAPHRSGDPWLSAKASGLRYSGDGGRNFTTVTSCQASYTLGFGKAAEGARGPAVYHVSTVSGVTGVYRSDDGANSWSRINDDQHQWDWIGGAVTGDPRVYGQVYLATDGGIQFGQPA